MNLLNTPDSNQINYGPTITAPSANGSISNYVINSVSNNHVNYVNAYHNGNGTISSNSNTNSLRASALSIKPMHILRNSPSEYLSTNGHAEHANIHLTLPSNINNMKLQNNTHANRHTPNENGHFNQAIDPVNDDESASDGEYIKSTENSRKSMENFMYVFRD